MSGGEPSGALRGIRTLFSDGMHGGLNDRQLLERFVSRDGASAEEAFAVLLERHGPMVWGVCRRLLHDRGTAADAFQATFLVLVRRASSVRVDDSLGPWLYGVSRRVAARARADTLRRRSRATGAVEAVAEPDSDPDCGERLAILDEEIGRLPERQRAAIVLCDLEGLPHEEAACRLGCPVGTIESRLSRGRQRLRDRLVRRGLTPAAAMLWAKTARDAAAAMPSALIQQSARFVTSAPATGAVPGAVAALAEGVIQMLWLARLKPLLAVAAIVVLGTAGVAVQGRQQPTPEGAREPAKPAPPPAPVVPEVEANRDMARRQLKLIEEALDGLNKLYQIARVDLSDPRFALWEQRRIDTLRKAGTGKAEMIAALESYIKRLKQQEEWAKTRHQSARGTFVEVLDAQFRLLEAESQLNEEKAR